MKQSTLEDLYYGNISSHERCNYIHNFVVGSYLKRSPSLAVSGSNLIYTVQKNKTLFIWVLFSIMSMGNEKDIYDVVARIFICKPLCK